MIKIIFRITLFQKTWNSFRSFKHAKEILLYEYIEYVIDDIEFALPKDQEIYSCW